MPLRDAKSPTGPLYRIGRPPDPLTWPRSAAQPGTNRFDDPLSQFRVLYAGASRRVCFLETLAPYRPRLAVLSQVSRIATASAGDDVRPWNQIPGDYFGRMVGTFLVEPDQRWLDFRSGETFQALREEHPDLILGFGYEDFDASHALGANRRLTQAIARIAYEVGYNGIVYKSRIDPMRDCWALFDRARIVPIEASRIAADDVDLVEVAALFGLKVK